MSLEDISICLSFSINPDPHLSEGRGGGKGDGWWKEGSGRQAGSLSHLSLPPNSPLPHLPHLHHTEPTPPMPAFFPYH